MDCYIFLKKFVLPVAEMDGPEAIVATNFTEHLVVWSFHSKVGVVEEYLPQEMVKTITRRYTL